MPLHPGQIEFIENGHQLKTKINVLTPSNRYGKTTLIACKQIWKHFYKFGVPTGNRRAWVKALYRTANVAPQSSLVEPVFNYIDQILTSSFPIQLPDGRITTNKCQIEWFYLKEQTRESPVHKQFFAFNSYIEHRTLGATAADSLEGKPYGYISYDECGRSKHLQEEVDGTLLARLFDWGGELDLVSTPDQTSPSILYHYEQYQKGLLPDHKATKTYTKEGALKDNIFFPPEQIQEQYDLYKDNPLGPQVLEGKFVFAGDNIFSPDDIMAIKNPDLNDGRRYEEDHIYVISTDTSMGSDEMVHTVMDITNLQAVRNHDGRLDISGEAPIVKQVAVKGNSKSPQRHLNDFLDLAYSYKNGGNLYHMLETWNGESARFYMDLPYDIQTLTTCYGSWQPQRPMLNNKNRPREKTQVIKKADIIVALQKLVSLRVIQIPSIDPNPSGKGADLPQQLTIYREKDENLPQDRVIGLALAAWKALDIKAKPQTIQFINVD